MGLTYTSGTFMCCFCHMLICFINVSPATPPSAQTFKLFAVDTSVHSLWLALGLRASIYLSENGGRGRRNSIVDLGVMNAFSTSNISSVGSKNSKHLVINQLEGPRKTWRVCIA